MEIMPRALHIGRISVARKESRVAGTYREIHGCTVPADSFVLRIVGYGLRHVLASASCSKWRLKELGLF
jgi:hypothetical protein